MFQKLITESTGKSPWLFHINAGSCNGCDIELVSVLTPRYDAERLGFKLSGTPRHADIVVVTGPVTAQSLDRVLRTIEQVPEPRCIVTMGSCPQSGNVFRGSYAIAGPLSKYVHVDVDVAGCTPKPEAVIDGLVKATEILREKRRAMKYWISPLSKKRSRRCLRRAAATCIRFGPARPPRITAAASSSTRTSASTA